MSKEKPVARVLKVSINEDTLQGTIEILSKELGESIDRAMIFPETEYQKATKTWWQKFKEWRMEMSSRIDTAIEVLRGRHYCGDEW